MAKRWWFVLLLLLCASATALAQATIPDTAAGMTFKAYLHAFNSGDGAQIEAYSRFYGDASNPNALPPPDAQIQFHNMTGGFDVLQIVKSGPLQKYWGGSLEAL